MALVLDINTNIKIPSFHAPIYSARGISARIYSSNNILQAIIMYHIEYHKVDNNYQDQYKKKQRKIQASVHNQSFGFC